MDYTAVVCRGCSQVIHVPSEEVPDDLRPGEWFERECKAMSCTGAYMQLLVRDDQKKGK